MKKQFYLKSLLSLLLLFIGMDAWATDLEITFPMTSQGKISSYTSSFTGVDSESGTWAFACFNNNNNAWSLIKCGYKSAATTSTITSPYISDKVTSYAITVDATASVNSAKLEVINNANTVVETKDITMAKGTVTVALTGTENCKYVLTIENAKTSSNGTTQISKLVLARTASDDTRTATTTSFPESAYSAYLGESFTSPTATVDNGGTVTYSSSATAVATVNTSTGEVSLVAPGTTTITASYAGDTTYKESSASYTLTVGKSYASLAALVADGAPTTTGIPVKVTLTDETIQSIALNSAGTSRMGIMLKSGDQDVEIYCYGVPTAWEANGTVSGTVTGTWKLFSSTWEICPSDWTELTYTASAKTNPTITFDTYKTTMAVGDADDEYTVTTNSDGALSVTSSDENVAEAIIVDNTVLVSAKAAGTTTITVKSAATATYYEASKSYTLTVIGPAALPFSFDGGVSDIASATGMSQSGLGSDYSASPKLKFNDTGDNVVIFYNGPAKILKYTIKGNSYSGGTFDVLESTDGETYTTVYEYGDDGNINYTECKELKSESRYVKFVYTNKSKGNIALGAISIANGYVRETGENEWYTICLPNAVEKDAFTGAKVYSIAGKRTSGEKVSSIVLKEETSLVAGTPYIICGTAANFMAAYTGDAVTEPVAATGLVGNLSSSALDVPTNCYIIGDDNMLHKITGTATATVGQNRAYIDLSGVDEYTGTGSAKLNIFDDGVATSIDTIDSLDVNAPVYNVAGQRVAPTTKGILIQNGRRFINK